MSIGATAKAFRIPLEDDATEALETLLGGLFGALVNAGLLEHKSRRIIAARKGLLEGVDARRSDDIMAAFQAGLEQLVEFEADDDCRASRLAGKARRRRRSVISAATTIVSRACRASGIRPACSTAMARQTA